MAEFAAFEVAAALTWTRAASTVQLALAADLVRRLPEVHAALARGDIDLPRARVFSDELSALKTATAQHAAAAVLPLAPELTTGQLRARLRKLVIEADPDAAAARHRARVRERRVVWQPSEDSCATLMGLDLPAETALAASTGLTEPGNLGALCRLHHRAKHQGGWVLRQLRPGVFVWVSPLGRRYTVRPQPPLTG